MVADFIFFHSHLPSKRVWNIRHILNETSPLLTEEARAIISGNGGLWPISLCNEKCIKECLESNQLIVTLSGTAVASGSSVYKLHVYESNCIEIGKTFENALAVGKDGKLTVDMSLIHTTVPQRRDKDKDSDADVDSDGE